MLHYYGDITAMELSELAKDYLKLYCRNKNEFCFVPFKDLAKGKKRYVKFQWLAVQFVFVDLVDKAG